VLSCVAQMDYYAVLGINWDADLQVVQKACVAHARRQPSRLVAPRPVGWLPDWRRV
jgi:hypothetical protein